MQRGMADRCTRPEIGAHWRGSGRLTLLLQDCASGSGPLTAAMCPVAATFPAPTCDDSHQAADERHHHFHENTRRHKYLQGWGGVGGWGGGGGVVRG